MKKKVYHQPAMKVVNLMHQSHILTGSRLNSAQGNAGLKYGGAGDGDANSRSFDWDDEE